MHKIDKPYPKEYKVLHSCSDSSNNIIQLVSVKEQFAVVHTGLQHATEPTNLETAVKVLAAAQAIPNTPNFSENTLETFEAKATEFLETVLKDITKATPKKVAAKKAAPKKTTSKK